MYAGKIKIPTLLIQPFVENAINHGILPKREKGKLVVTFSLLTGKEVVCTVEDDGVGRKKISAGVSDIADKKVSYGNILIDDLVKVFNRYEHMDINVQYADKESPDTGTVVTIEVKNPYHDK
jgi:LytS/YehU family sensor histidine kinase